MNVGLNSEFHKTLYMLVCSDAICDYQAKSFGSVCVCVCVCVSVCVCVWGGVMHRGTIGILDFMVYLEVRHCGEPTCSDSGEGFQSESQETCK